MIVWGLFFSVPFLVPLLAAMMNLNYLVLRLMAEEEFAIVLPRVPFFDRAEEFCYRWFAVWVAYAVGMLASLGCLS